MLFFCITSGDRKSDNVQAGTWKQSPAADATARSQPQSSSSTDEDALGHLHKILLPSQMQSAVKISNEDGAKGEQYIHLEECWTGNRKSGLDFVPPAPSARAPSIHTNHSLAFDDRKTNLGANSKSISPSPDRISANMTYDKPRSYQPISTSSMGVFSHSYYPDSRDDEYDIPKRSCFPNVHDNMNSSPDDMYDIPRPPVPKSVPLKHKSGSSHSIAPDRNLQEGDDRYINLPENSKCHPMNSDSNYDFPQRKDGATNQMDINDTALLELTPPPPTSHMPKSHKYVNATTGFVHAHPPQEKNDHITQMDIQQEKRDRVPALGSKQSQNNNKYIGNENLEAVVPRALHQKSDPGKHTRILYSK